MDLLPLDAEPLLTPAEVATMFRVSRTTVTRWANDGKLTTIRTLGGHRRYRSAEIRGLLAGIPVRQPEPGGQTHQGSTVTTVTAALSPGQAAGLPARARRAGPRLGLVSAAGHPHRRRARGPVRPAGSGTSC
jgi:excisionase family DNA binding protein